MLARDLSLPSEGTQPMTILTFGSSQEQSQFCNRVRLSLTLKDFRMKQLKYLTVPMICEPLSCQPFSLSQAKFEHLADLDLADYSDDSSRLEVDILVGLDQYWELATGEVRRGQAGPVALNTSLGWVLSGPSSSLDQIQASTSLLTHVLRVDGVVEGLKALDDRLKSFWDLESLGITPFSCPDSSVVEDFKKSIRFVDGRYQVELPWKESHPPLTDHYNLCVKRLKGLLRRLQQDPN